MLNLTYNGDIPGISKTYTRKIPLIFLGQELIKAKEDFMNQLSAITLSHQIPNPMNPVLHVIKKYIAGINRYTMIGMFPEYIKIGNKTQMKYDKIAELFNVIKMTKHDDSNMYFIKKKIKKANKN